MLYISNARNEVLWVEFKEATDQEFLLLKGKDIIAEHRASQKQGHCGAGWRFSFLLIPLSTDHCVVLGGPTTLCHFENRALTQALNTTFPLYL